MISYSKILLILILSFAFSKAYAQQVVNMHVDSIKSFVPVNGTMNNDAKTIAANGHIAIDFTNKTMKIDNVVNKSLIMPIADLEQDTDLHDYKFIMIDSSGNDWVLHMTRTDAAFVYGKKIYFLKIHYETE